MTKQQEFNRIAQLIKNPKNTGEHLEPIKVMVEHFADENKGSNLAKVLIQRFIVLEKKFKD